MTKTEIEQINLYNNEIQISYYPNSHQYRINGERIVSVTGVTGIIDKSPQLLAWAERLTNEYMSAEIWNEDGSERMQGLYSPDRVQELVKEAAHQYTIVKTEASEIGNIVHKFASDFIQATIDRQPLPRIDEVPQEALNGISAFLDWYKAHKVEFVKSEFIVYSKKYGYIGRCDLLAWIDDELTIADFKTSKEIWPEAKLQLAAYVYAYDEEDQKLAKKRLSGKASILHFDKQNGAFTVHPVKNLKKSFLGFKSALKLKQTLKELK